MASKIGACTAVLLLSLLFFTSVSAQRRIRRRPPPPPPPPSPPPPPPSPPPPPPSPPPPPFFPFRSCRAQAARLSVCSSVVRGLKLGFLPPRFPCCRVVRQLSDQQATTCLCYAARFGFLGLRVRIPGDLVQLLFYCGRPVPSGFTCS
ncbi:unnamed protein product [Spirodela intermedia]|uniref:Bifunctional inhibitor/plant lipid transfer protein/seed storage helical domain-containing protein n=1 Tax=Spirodela intermedia TaxID=51605 RepID=A0A7I8KX69_SPIIN|nr:unnamed protein product [Spirodela intermedia]